MKLTSVNSCFFLYRIAAPDTSSAEVAVAYWATKKDVPASIRRTGFDEKKARNVASKAFSQKKIKKADRGSMYQIGVRYFDWTKIDSLRTEMKNVNRLLT